MEIVNLSPIHPAFKYEAGDTRIIGSRNKICHRFQVDTVDRGDPQLPRIGINKAKNIPPF